MEELDNTDKSVIKWDTLVHDGPYFKYLSSYGSNSESLVANEEEQKVEKRPHSSISLSISNNTTPLILRDELIEYAKLFVYELDYNKHINDGVVQVWKNQPGSKFLNMEEIYKNEYASMFVSNFFYGRVSATKQIKGFVQYLSNTDDNEGYRPNISDINWQKVPVMNTTKESKEVRDAVRKKYGFCDIDGTKGVEIKKFDISRPFLYIPQDKDKYVTLGLIKKEILPEDVTINSSDVVKCPKGHNWKDSITDHSVEWLWKWEDNSILRGKGNKWGKEIYAYPADTSKIKINSALNRYDGARILNELSHNIVEKQIQDAGVIVKEIYKDGALNNQYSVVKIKQIVCVYLLFTQGFRIDSTSSSKNENGEQVVGLCGLTYDNVKMLKWNSKDKSLELSEDGGGKDIRFLNRKDYTTTADFSITDITKEGDYVWFEFKGKDDVFCYRLAQIDSNIWMLLKILKALAHKNSGVTGKLFKGLNSDDINILLKTYTENNTISAKTVRTQVASKFMYENLEYYTEQKQDALKNATGNARKNVITQIFKLANTDVAKFLNHKQTRNRTSWNLDTSINRYIDPRIIVSWCLKNDVPIHYIFNATRRKDFDWAIKKTPSGTIWNWNDSQPEIISKLCSFKENLTEDNFKLLNVLYENNRKYLIYYISDLLKNKSPLLNTIDENFGKFILSYTK